MLPVSLLRGSAVDRGEKVLRYARTTEAKGKADNFNHPLLQMLEFRSARSESKVRMEGRRSSPSLFRRGQVGGQRLRTQKMLSDVVTLGQERQPV